MIDHAYVDDIPDSDLANVFDPPRDVQVELVMRDAPKWYKTKGPDVVELYSPPRIVREAGLLAYGG